MNFITPIPAFSDNYLWLIEQDQSNAVIIDPGDASAVMNILCERKINLNAILVTHHHGDHIGGLTQLLNHYDVPVYGPSSVKIPQISHPLHEGERVQLFNNTVDLQVLEIPGHTRDHIAYFGEINNQPCLFCGDTLFAAGCGRLFDGTHEQLRQSLERLKQLPEHTHIYCAHEYTLANLAFAKTVEPNNRAIQERTNTERLKRSQGQPTLPSTLAIEKKTNPFLRYQEPQVIKAINEHWQQQWQTPEQLFAGLRRWKDVF